MSKKKKWQKTPVTYEEALRDNAQRDDEAAPLGVRGQGRRLINMTRWPLHGGGALGAAFLGGGPQRGFLWLL